MNSTTPEPWSIQVSDDGTQLNIGNKKLDRVVCSILAVPDEEGCIDDMVFTKEDLANAVLIKASKGLLDACLYALEQVEAHTEGMSEKEFEDSAWQPLYHSLITSISRATDVKPFEEIV